MKVQELMSAQPVSCYPWSNLSEVAMMMWNHDCGAIPVLSDRGSVVGMVTDRDICMGVATQHRRAEEITVSDVTSGVLYSCHPGDSMQEALQLMQDHQVRRLPVVDWDDQLLGIISLNDMIQNARIARSPTYAEVINTLKIVGKGASIVPIVAERAKGKQWKTGKTSGLSS